MHSHRRNFCIARHTTVKTIGVVQDYASSTSIREGKQVYSGEKFYCGRSLNLLEMMQGECGYQPGYKNSSIRVIMKVHNQALQRKNFDSVLRQYSKLLLLHNFFE